jgi:hypothetical protein
MTNGNIFIIGGAPMIHIGSYETGRYYKIKTGK